MDDFYRMRREPFLNEKTFAEFVIGRVGSIKFDQGLLDTEQQGLADDDGRHIDWRWGIASSRLQLLIGKYSAGEQVSTIAPEFEPCLRAIEATALPHTYRTEPFYLDELDTYAYAMWLLSLAKLLRLDHLMPRVAALFDVAREDNRGKDALFEALLAKLGLPAEAAPKCYKHLKAHPLLLQAIQAEPDKRPIYMAEFLKKWYPAMKGTYWHGRHERVPQNFFGYWAFEAGLVTYLWEIDDKSYRDLPFYPKDLVDYARSHPAAAQPEPAAPAAPARPPSVPAGEPCPRAGFWFTPAKASSRRRFELGELMPDAGNKHWGTFWQWDDDRAK